MYRQVFLSWVSPFIAITCLLPAAASGEDEQAPVEDYLTSVELSLSAFTPYEALSSDFFAVPPVPVQVLWEAPLQSTEDPVPVDLAWEEPLWAAEEPVPLDTVWEEPVPAAEGPVPANTVWEDPLPAAEEPVPNDSVWEEPFADADDVTPDGTFWEELALDTGEPPAQAESDAPESAPEEEAGEEEAEAAPPEVVPPVVCEGLPFCAGRSPLIDALDSRYYRVREEAEQALAAMLVDETTFAHAYEALRNTVPASLEQRVRIERLLAVTEPYDMQRLTGDIYVQAFIDDPKVVIGGRTINVHTLGAAALRDLGRELLAAHAVFRNQLQDRAALAGIPENAGRIEELECELYALLFEVVQAAGFELIVSPFYSGDYSLLFLVRGEDTTFSVNAGFGADGVFVMVAPRSSNVQGDTAEPLEKEVELTSLFTPVQLNRMRHEGLSVSSLTLPFLVHYQDFFGGQAGEVEYMIVVERSFHVIPNPGELLVLDYLATKLLQIFPEFADGGELDVFKVSNVNASIDAALVRKGIVRGERSAVPTMHGPVHLIPSIPE